MNSGFKGLKGLNRPILITGHTGFKGAWLSLILRNLGIETVGLSLPAESGALATQLEGSVWDKQYFTDIRDRDGVDRVMNEVRPSFIFHLAAQAIVLESYANPVKTFETNVLGTANLLEATRNQTETRGFIIATTDKVYSNSNLGRRFVESDPLMGTDPYSASKVGTEAVVKAWQTMYEGRQDFGITAVRSGNVIGGGDSAANRLLPDLIRSFSSNTVVEVRNPNSTRPWQHVADPLLGYLMAAESILVGKRVPSFNFGPFENSLTVAEVVEIARASWSDSTQFKIVKPDANLYEAGLLELDAGLAQRELKWKPKYSQVDSVKSTVEWWKRTLNQKMSATEACISDLERYEF